MFGRGMLLSLAIAGLTGCRATSKWALDSPTYAEKYDRPYSEHGWRKHRRMAKQLVDARFVAGESGFYTNAEFQSDPAHLGGELGLITFPYSFMSGRLGLAGLLTEGPEPGFLAGLDGGVRFFAPTRLAPFVGIGGFAGYQEDQVTIFLDDPPPPATSTVETQTNGNGLAAIYPEIGVGFWWNGHTQLALNSRYYVTTDGRETDRWTVGVGLTILTGPRPGDLQPRSSAGALEIDEISSADFEAPQSPAAAMPAPEDWTIEGYLRDDSSFLRIGPIGQELPLMTDPELP